MFANSQKQTLAMHSLAVANIALKLFLKLNIPQTNPLKKTFENIQSLSESIFFAGLLHDLGKCDIIFQVVNLQKLHLPHTWGLKVQEGL